MGNPSPALPGGTVTFLFTDIEGSTRLLDELGERYVAVLDEHRRALRAAFANHDGVELGTEGDSFFVVFTSAAEAVAAAGEGQQNLAEGPVRVRMGLHTGAPTITSEGYVGMDIHRAARISAVAHGGQVIFSERTRSQLAEDVAVTDLGLHRLKDLGEPERLFQLGDDHFPPLRSLNASNLPAQPNRLIGREQELLEVTSALRDGVRLLTLAGPGGTGKTRLALQAAAELTDEYKDGVFWVSLAAATDANVALSTIGQTLGARVPLAQHIDEKRMLLLLDNLEQVLEVGPALADLLTKCPNLQLLATSRALLHVSPEKDYQVPVLPDDEAVALFRERAAVVEPEDAVREICRRLDGLPLAVELAAARTRLLTPDQLLSRLDQRLPLLTGGARDAPERQRTLRATIEWSYDLLDDRERGIFAALGVFAGSFTFEAAEEVCSASLDRRQDLIEHSLLRRWASGRLGMLETIREYAVEKLAQDPGQQALRRNHLQSVLGIAESANVTVEAIQAERKSHHDLVNPEIDNVRAALAWAIDSGDRQLGLRLAIALEQFWVATLPFEGSRWFEQLLEGEQDLPADLQARALRAYGGSVYIAGDFERGRGLYDQSLAIFRSLDDERGAGHLLFRIAYDEFRRGNYDAARSLVAESLEIHERLGIRADEAQSLTLMAELAKVDGDPSRALALYKQGAERARESGFLWWLQSTLLQIVELTIEIGNLDDARAPLGESLQLSLKTLDRQGAVYALAVLAALEAMKRDPYHAGLFWGAVEADEQRGPIGQWETSGDRDTCSAAVFALDGEDLRRGLGEGRALSLDDALDEAIAFLGG